MGRCEHSRPDEECSPDENGYILYCPCMGKHYLLSYQHWEYENIGSCVLYFCTFKLTGRFGNQADHFLGSLAFAKALNRTLVLPHWIVHRSPKHHESPSVMVPFDDWFQVAPLQGYHRVILMAEFMRSIAPVIWPPGERAGLSQSLFTDLLTECMFPVTPGLLEKKKVGLTFSVTITVLCYMARKGPDGDGCNAKDGNPFGPFWDHINVNFDRSEIFQPLHYDIHRQDNLEKWKEKYPPKEWPVLAFVGAPASFPVQEENIHLQKYFKWTEEMVQKGSDFKRTHLPRGAYVGIHLRNGIDWERACSYVDKSQTLFSSPQCVGYRNDKGPTTQEMCLPPLSTIVKHVKRAVKQVNAQSVFVASDNNHYIPELSKALEKMQVSVHKLDPPDPQLDLVILGLSNHFIGNCVSSFSAFVKRDRDAIGFPSSFFGFPVPRHSSAKEGNNFHDEL
ncbi:unnamed protein product [Darwinula stevensoni]|uniref:GDP-fucose protein O-fucosyltransferase 1 n=1 Tax=Darwinula stevensoni TaxID=69355 RepID=A0A7R8XLM9_9CRUS|nr:unnamed protein product [Darwinula stevensoni]CAG0894445.1 unnamed protein product [Darwinula stevensoni]